MAQLEPSRAIMACLAGGRADIATETENQVRVLWINCRLRSKRPRHRVCQGRPWRSLPAHRGHDSRKQPVDSSRGDSFLARNSLAAWRGAGIIRRHAGARRLAVVVELGIAGGLA